jgi:hypothetical protein
MDCFAPLAMTAMVFFNSAKAGHPAREIGAPPQHNQNGLANQKHWRAEKPGEAFGFEGAYPR